MDTNGKYTKKNSQIASIIHLVRNVEEWNLHKKVWCEEGMKLENIETKNVRGD